MAVYIIGILLDHHPEKYTLFSLICVRSKGFIFAVIAFVSGIGLWKGRPWGWYPGTLYQLVAVGEKSGALDTQLLELGQAQEEEIDLTCQRFTDLLGPFITILLGLFVAFIMAAIIMPLADFGEF